jgi:cytochrome oxidase assembly protein ShyY1
VYRFLLTPRWIGLGVLMVSAAAVMVGLGLWQLDRYEHRSAINARIDAAAEAPPVPMTDVLDAPSVSEVGPAPAADALWARVTVTGRYDASQEILARARTVDGRVGFEIVTPLVLTDGSAVLVDRGWVPPGGAGAATPPTIPPAPTGDVTVIGRIHAPESRGGAAEPFGGLRSVRRIAPALLAADLPYPIYGAYLTLDSQIPPADPAFVPIAPEYENAWMNAGYLVQWWAFATLTLAGYVFLAVRQARVGRELAEPETTLSPLSPLGGGA